MRPLPKSPKVKLRARKPVLSNDSKMKLASSVEQFPEIWKLDHPRYKLRDSHGKSWEKIAQVMEVPVLDCKAAWKSMRDALRYRKATQLKPGKSGDSCPEESDGEESHVRNDDNDDHLKSWVFYDCMKFVANQKSARSTLSSMLEFETQESEVLPETDNTNDAEGSLEKSPIKVCVDSSDGMNITSEVKRSNYDYGSHVKPKRKRCDAVEVSTTRLAAGIEDLVKLRKERLSTLPQNHLEYNSMYVNLDRMLKQLPTSVVEGLNMQFVKLTYEAIQRQEVIIYNSQ